LCPWSVTPTFALSIFILMISLASSVAVFPYTTLFRSSPLGATTTATTVAVTVTAVPFDYVLSNNGPVSITAGSSGTVTITAKLTGGAAQSVALARISTLLYSITFTTFSPASFIPTSAGATSILPFSVFSSVAAGSYSVIVLSLPDALPISATTVAVTVTAVPFDYVLSNNGPVSITAGSSGTVTITAKLTGGAAQSVA